MSAATIVFLVLTSPLWLAGLALGWILAGFLLWGLYLALVIAYFWIASTWRRLRGN